jgi:ribonuclease PH
MCTSQFVNSIIITRVGIYEAELEEYIQSCAENAILTEQHPRTAITITAQAFEADGSLLATAINATCLALLDAAVATRHLVVAVCCAVRCDGTILLDPTKDEEKVGGWLMMLLFWRKPNILELERGCGCNVCI